MCKIAICDDDKEYREKIKTVIETEGILSSNEIRFYEYESGKEDVYKRQISVCAEKSYEIWKDTAAQKSAQLIFCDLSTPKGDGSFNAVSYTHLDVYKRQG